MNICNCHKDLNEYLCDVPLKWRKPIVDVLCALFNTPTFDCKQINTCETVTSLGGFQLLDGTLSTSYKDEYGNIHTPSVNIGQIIDNIFTNTEENCLEESSNIIDSIISKNCECCTTTTTTSTTTTTTIPPYEYYFADEYECIYGNCSFVASSLVIMVPTGFLNNPSYYYPSDSNPSRLFQITAVAAPQSAILLDVEGGAADCSVFCPTTTTTTSTTTSSTTTTTSTSTSTTTTSSTTTTTSSSTTTTTTVCPEINGLYGEGALGVS